MKSYFITISYRRKISQQGTWRIRFPFGIFQKNVYRRLHTRTDCMYIGIYLSSAPYFLIFIPPLIHNCAQPCCVDIAFITETSRYIGIFTRYTAAYLYNSVRCYFSFHFSRLFSYFSSLSSESRISSTG